MPAIGDQVATLEHDHTAALALIDSLKSDNASLQAKLADMQTHVDEVKTMVEDVASGALKMLQSVQVTARAIPAEVLTKVETLAAGAEKVVQTAIAGDSGDEQSAAPIMSVGLSAAPTGRTASPLVTDDLVPTAPPISPALGAPHGRASFEQKMSEGVKTVMTDVENIPLAVDRMLHHSSAASTLIRRPVDLTMHVDHDEGGLPIFLRRDTVFQREGRPQT